MQMPAHAESADHHDRADGILRSAGKVGLRKRGFAFGRSLGFELVNNHRFCRPIAIQRRDQIAIGLNGPRRFRPRCTGCIAFHINRIIGQTCEKRLPFGGHGRCVFLPAGMQHFDIVCIAAIEERCSLKLFIAGAAVVCHRMCP